MRQNQTGLYFFLLTALAVILLIINVCAGSVQISPHEVLDILSRRPANPVSADIILQIRLPRTLAAAILGGGLSLSGYLLQTYFHNPIAGPFILGISSGAKLAVAGMMVAALRASIPIHSVMMIVAAFAGAMISMGFVLLISRVVDRISMLIVSGVMIGYICSAITDLIVTFADDSDIVNLHNWSKGSFSGISWENVAVMTVVIFAAFFCVLLLSKPIGAWQMGEAYARNMGVHVPLFRALLVVLSSVLSACVTAFAGPVSFVGIAVPHLIKGLFRTANPLRMIPACFLGGAIFCLACDLLARVLFAPTELGISTVTSIFGAPIVIHILIRRENARPS
ncbi:MAG: iron ABC transporter permease [Clostridiales bacterium]|nr:iron ABC transporter permease [Clostridiales bacterium]